MKTENFSGTIENAYGQALPAAIKFTGSFEAFENIEEVKEKNEYPKDSEIVSFVNARRKANERQKSMTAALEAAGITKPTLEDSVDLQVKQMVRAMVASGKHTEDSATKLARQLLGLPEEVTA